MMMKVYIYGHRKKKKEIPRHFVKQLKVELVYFFLHLADVS